MSAFSPEVAARLRALSCRGTFEAHLTVEDARADAFEALCGDLGVDCVRIELARGAHASQPMTASHHDGDLAAVIDEIEQLHAQVTGAGFAVVRVKLEAMPSNTGVPQTDAEAAAQPDAYFELHVKVRLPPGADLDALRALCERHGAHLSRNDRARDPDGGALRFVTLRADRIGRAHADARFDALVATLADAGHDVRGTTTEYTIHDGRLELDAGWLEPA